VKEVFDRIGKDTLGYDADCFCVQVLVSQQSPDIAQGVDKGGAGDQGMMFGFRSKGIMTEAVRQICKISFSELDIIRITGLVYAPNIASRKVLEKNDFVQEGLQRNAVFKDDKVYDLCVYGKLK